MSEPAQSVPPSPPVPPVLSAAEWRHRPLLIQCWASETPDLAPYTDRPGGGLVITAANGSWCEAYERARELRERGYRRPMLLDAARYAVRKPDPADFDLAWLDCQRELGLPVLTDSGLVRKGDGEGLARILDRAKRLGDAIALLPLHPSWLVDSGARAALLLRIRHYRVPVAILLEHADDPFGMPGAVDGLRDVLACAVPVLLLRCDVSALGALACGAVAAAVGTNAALRHLHPGRYTNSEPSVFVPSCLSYKRLDRISEARRSNPDAVLWRCTCPTCNDSDLDWFLTQPARRWPALVAAHSVNVLLDLREDRVVGSDPYRDRLSWQEQCWHANWQREQVGWGPEPALEHWLRAIAGSADPLGNLPG